jgi:hypothetical protein
MLTLWGAVVLAGSGCSAVDPQAEKALMKSLGSTSFTVFPAVVRRQAISYDENAAMRMGEFITAEGLGQATVAEARVAITGPWHMNQARMLRESAAEFASYVKDHPIKTAYAVLPEYLLGGSGTVRGIHGYVVDKDGKVVFAVLQNSKWPAFHEVNPQTVDDCTEVLVRVLRESLRPANADR